MRPIAFGTAIAAGLLFLIAPDATAARKTPIKRPSKAAPAKTHEKMPDLPPSGGRVRIQTDAWGASWDWNQDPGQIPAEVLRAVHRGLYRLGTDGSLESDLADSESSSSDSRTWTFKLRRGVVWSDGTPLSAQHVVDGVLRAVDPTTSTLPASALNIEGVIGYHSRQPGVIPAIQATSDRVIEVKLVHPDPLFPLRWLDTRLMPARGDLALANSKGYGFEPEKMAFLGKMILTESRPGLRTMMIPNPLHTDSAGLPRIELWHTPAASQAASLFERGHIDVALTPDIPTRTGKVVSLEQAELIVLVPNSDRARSKQAMLAVSIALDRKGAPGIRPALDWIPAETWKLQSLGPYPQGLHPEQLTLEDQPSLARSLWKPSGKEFTLKHSKRDDALAAHLRTSIGLALGIRVHASEKSKGNPDWTLLRFPILNGDMAAMLDSLDPQGGWREWGRLAIQDPVRLSRFIERTRKVLVESPTLIPVGFGLKQLRVKNYVNPPAVLGIGVMDLGSISYDPSFRKSKAPKPSPAGGS